MPPAARCGGIISHFRITQMTLFEQVKKLAELQKHATPRPYFVYSEAQGDETGYTHTDHWLTPQPGPTNDAGEYNDIASVANYADAEFFKEAGSLDFAALAAALSATPAAAATPVAGEAAERCYKTARIPYQHFDAYGNLSVGYRDCEGCSDCATAAPAAPVAAVGAGEAGQWWATDEWLQHLRKTALQARKEWSGNIVGWHPESNLQSIHDVDATDAAFIAQARPDTILALLDRAALPTPAPATAAAAGAGEAPNWRDPNRGPRSEWKDGVQILHPVLVAREGAEEAELAYWCDMNDEWLGPKLDERLNDVEGWLPLPPLPAPPHPATPAPGAAEATGEAQQ